MSVEKLESHIINAGDEGKASAEAIACARSLSADKLSAAQRSSIGQATEIFLSLGAVDQESVEFTLALGLLNPSSNGCKT